MHDPDDELRAAAVAECAAFAKRTTELYSKQTALALLKTHLECFSIAIGELDSHKSMAEFHAGKARWHEERHTLLEEAARQKQLAKEREQSNIVQFRPFKEKVSA